MTKNLALIFVSVTLSFICFSQPPTINSFTPASGSVGTIVVINGNNFNTTPENNVVYFGAVKATVSAASAISLTVTVPKNASFFPITVTNKTNGLTSYSSKPFLVTFPGGDNNFTINSFDNGSLFATDENPGEVAIGDFDLDGKPDIVSKSYIPADGLSIFRNTSLHGSISFAPRLEIPDPGNGVSNSICLGDINGDGLLDIVTTSAGRVSVFKNQSTPGVISFATPFNYTNNLQNVGCVRINDLDKDGKPDIIANAMGAIFVFKNNSTIGALSLANPVTVAAAANNTNTIEQFDVADLDADNNAEIIIAYYTRDTISILRNLGTPGSFSFASPVYYNTGFSSNPGQLSIADMDNDRLPDIVYSSNMQDRIGFLKNNSTAGTISFTPLSSIVNQYLTYVVATADLNGDGKIDLAANYPTFFQISVFKNSNTPCNINFDPKVNLDGDGSNEIALNDLNGDGKPDIVINKRVSNFLKVYKNTIGQTIQSCAGSNISISSSVTGSVYQWQQNSGGGYVDITNGSNYSGTNTSTLQINNLPLAWNGYKYHCIVGTDTSNVIALSVNTAIMPSITISSCPTPVCAGHSTTLTAVSLNGGTNPAYQWQDSTSMAGWLNIANATSSTLTYTPSANGNKIRCVITSSYSCANPASVTSNTLVLQVNSLVTPVVAIAGNTTVNQGQSTTLTAIVTNGGTNPLYQWQDSTNASSWTNIPGAVTSTLVYFPTQTGAKIRCRVTGNGICAAPQPGVSNVVVLMVNNITGINVVSASNYGIRYYPNPVKTILIIDSLKAMDKWQTIDIITADGKQKVISKNITGFSRIAINVEKLSGGLYVAVLNRREGPGVYLKLIKK